MNIEKRTFTHRVELRAEGDNKFLDGYAAKYNSLSGDLGGFRERISPGAFASVLGNDVRCLLNHDANVILGRTKAGTLRIASDMVGLRFACALPNTSAARDLHESVSRGDIDQCSFSFTVDRDEWDEDTDENDDRFIRRTIRSFKSLSDVSVVTYPAYVDTSVNARAVVAENVLVEARNRAARTVRPELPRVVDFRKHMAERFKKSIARANEQDKALRGLSPLPTEDDFRRRHAEEIGRQIEREYYEAVEADRRKPFQHE